MIEHITQILDDRADGPMSIGLVHIWQVTIAAILSVGAIALITAFMILAG